MQANSLPIVYAETNWLVALAFPHDQWFGRAKSILDEGARQRCEIRLRYAARLEAPHRMRRKSTELNKLVADFRDVLSTGIRNGETTLQSIYDAANQAVLGDYVQRDTLATIDSTIEQAEAVVIPFHPDVLTVVEELRPHVKHRGGDMADLAMLGAIIHDRRMAGPDRAAILFSTNAAEFDPREKKLPPDLLKRERMIFYNDLDLTAALQRWRATFAPDKK